MNDEFGKIYCPICASDLLAVNADDVESGFSDSYVFVHDNFPHSDTDLHALEYGIN